MGFKDCSKGTIAQILWLLLCGRAGATDHYYPFKMFKFGKAMEYFDV